ncbi:MAG: SCP2 sterol-binding domain-containing protein [Thermodesulfobacteriota bacterium]
MMPDNDHGPVVRHYFGAYLSGFMGQQLIKNLMSLSARFWIEITGHACWSLTIEKGVLLAVDAEQKEGRFGFSTDAATFLAVAGNRLSPQKSFFTGKTRISGSFPEALRTATALEEFFQRYPYPADEAGRSSASERQG